MNRTTVDGDQPGAAQAEQRVGAQRTERNGQEAEANVRRREVERLREIGRNLGGQIEEQVRKRPLVVAGAAAGIGFVAGSLFGSRLGQVLLAVGIGYMAKNLASGELGVDRIQARIEKLANEASVG